MSRVPSWMLQFIGLLLVLFLLLPIGAIFGLGLYYTLGIFLVADASQMMAALGKESGIAPALLQTPLIAIAVTLLASAWGLALSLLWRHWIVRRHYFPLMASALPFLLPRFGLGALFLLACLKLAQWGGNALGLALVAASQAAVAAPLIAAILCLGWRRVDPAWREAALEAGADEMTIFRRLTFPLLKPFMGFGAILAMILSLGDFYLGNALSGDTLLLPGAILSGVAQNVSPLYHALVAVMVLVDVVLLALVTRSLKRLAHPRNGILS
ncbi:ABC transporter permease subunit [Dongia sp.]|uniref:ABC transporter permease subunit n=1 Tax=Dongia sp. TaxID=1977262 RepID=UPI0035B15D29